MSTSTSGQLSWLQQLLYSRHGKCESHKCVLPFQDYFEYSQFLEFPHEFQDHLVNFTKKSGGVSMGTALNARVFSRVRLFATTWTIACQLSSVPGISQSRTLKGLPFPSPDLPDPGIKRMSLVSHWQALFTTGSQQGSPLHLTCSSIENVPLFDNIHSSDPNYVLIFKLHFLVSRV